MVGPFLLEAGSGSPLSPLKQSLTWEVVEVRPFNGALCEVMHAGSFSQAVQIIAH